MDGKYNELAMYGLMSEPRKGGESNHSLYRHCALMKCLILLSSLGFTLYTSIIALSTAD